MKIEEIKCRCGHGLRTDRRDRGAMRCPGCGRIVALLSKEKDPSRRDRLDRFIEATFELLEEGEAPFSGAR